MSEYGKVISRWFCLVRQERKEDHGREEESEDDVDWGSGEHVTWEAEQRRERWDCESVLSRLSNLDNHPGRISDPGKRQAPISGLIRSADFLCHAFPEPFVFL